MNTAFIDSANFWIAVALTCSNLIQRSQAEFCSAGRSALAESKYKLFVPHTWGTGIKLAAGLQLAGSTPNCPFIECCIDMPAIDQIHDPLLKRPLEFRKDGCLVVPQEPGLGIEIDENAVSTFSRSRGHDH